MLLFHLVVILVLALFTLERAQAAGSSIVAGGNSAVQDITGNNQLARDASFSDVNYIWSDANGNLYASATSRHVIVRIDGSSNTLTIVAGSLDNSVSYTDGAPVTETLSAAGFKYPKGVWGDDQGNLYVADSNYIVRKIDASRSTVTRVAGSGKAGGRLANPNLSGAPLTVDLGGPSSIWGDNKGNLYIYDLASIFLSNGASMSVFAGQFKSYGFSANSNPLEIKIRGTGQISGDSHGNIFFADSLNSVYWRVNANGQASILMGSVAGSSVSCTGDEASVANPLCASVRAPFGVWVDPSSDKLYLTSTHVNSPVEAVPDRVLTMASADATSFSTLFSPTNNPGSLTGDRQGKLYAAFSFGINSYPLSARRSLRSN